MKTYLIEFTETTKRVKNRVLNRLYWYDSVGKKMYTILGDQLRFEWKPEIRRSVPAAEWSPEHQSYVMKEQIFGINYQRVSNKDEVKEWVENVGKRFGVEIDRTESDNKGLAIEVDDSVSQQVEYAMDRQNFRFTEL